MVGLTYVAGFDSYLDCLCVVKLIRLVVWLVCLLGGWFGLIVGGYCFCGGYCDCCLFTCCLGFIGYFEFAVI